MNNDELQPYLIAMRSLLTGKVHEREIHLTPDQYEELHSDGRRVIQQIVPHLSAEDREFLISGITPEEWAAEFGTEE